MQKGYNANAYPYTPPVGLMRGLQEALNTIEGEGLENVLKRHTRIATGVRLAVDAWGLKLCANAPCFYSDSVTAIRTPDGFNATDIVTVADEKYGMAFGVGLGDVAGKVFRIGHLGMLTDAMMLSGLSVAEMVMVDLGLDIKLGSGVAAAQEFYRHGS
jgi:alanine-glyoxylate transaminase/serine-glyoxylate transaminase/serine-pyruvate transaminase